MEIGSSTTSDGPEATALSSETPVKRRPAGLVLAILGAILLINAQSMPWVSVTVENAVLRYETAGTYRLADLPTAAVPLYVGWVLLAGLFAAALARPGWRPVLFRLGFGLAAVLAFLTFDLGRAAIETAGYRPGTGPDSELLSGAFLAVFGTVLMAAGIAAPTVLVPVRPDRPATASPRQPAPPSPSSAGVEGVGWSARPEWVPWWRRRGPIVAVAAGVVAVTLVSGAAVWLFLHRPPPPRDHSGDLRQLVAPAPAGAVMEPYPNGADGQLDLNQVTGSSSSPDPSTYLLQLANIRRGITQSWTESDGALVMITLIQSRSVETATQFLRTYRLQAKTRSDDSDIQDVPGVPDARLVITRTLDNQGRVRVQVTGQRRDIVFLITEARSAPIDLAHINTLAHDQYERL